LAVGYGEAHTVGLVDAHVPSAARTDAVAGGAARSAIAFGIDVVEKYLRVVSHATHPVRVFDALYGLSAIALEDADAAKSVLAELRSLKGALKRRNLEHLPLIDAACSGAIEPRSCRRA
jgi:hypothetical protein